MQQQQRQRRARIDAAFTIDHRLVPGVQAGRLQQRQQARGLLRQRGQFQRRQVHGQGHMAQHKGSSRPHVHRRHLRQPEGLQHRAGPGLQPVGVARQVGVSVGPHRQLALVLQPALLRLLKELDLRVAQQELQRKEGHRRGAAATAIGQHLLLGPHPQVLQHGLQLGGRLEGFVGVEKVVSRHQRGVWHVPSAVEKRRPAKEVLRVQGFQHHVAARVGGGRQELGQLDPHIGHR